MHLRKFKPVIERRARDMSLHFTVSIDNADDWNALVKFMKMNKFPIEFSLSEFDVLSIIKMSKGRNRGLHDRLLSWYQSIDERFRIV